VSSFTLDLQAFAKKAGARADLAVKRVVAGMAESIIEMSPVGDGVYWKSPPPKGYVGGRFRANWDYGFGAAPTRQYEELDKTGAISTQRILGGLTAAPSAGIHFIANNLPYAQRIENGWSRQAPVGVVGVTVLKFSQVVRGAVQ
jgi:hypothetical protein